MLIQISPFRLVYRYFCPALCSLNLYEIAGINLPRKFKIISDWKSAAKYLFWWTEPFKSIIYNIWKMIWIPIVIHKKLLVKWKANLKLLLHKDFGPIVPNHWPDFLDKLGSYAKANFLTQSRINFPKSPINPWDGYFFRYKAWQLLLPATIPMYLLGFLQVFSVNNFQVLDDFDW